jgi:hypothetical protein
MKRPIGVSVTVALVGALAALALTGLSPGTLSVSAQQHAQAVEAGKLFDKFMSSHAPMIRATGSVAPSSPGVTLGRSPGTIVSPSASSGSATSTSSPSIQQLTSYNWSGFADVQNTTGTGPGSTGPGSQPLSSVSGSWTVPQVSCVSGLYQNQDVFIANWVGLDGFNDGTVEQLGTGVECYENVEYYYDWYEMFPNGTVQEGPLSCINDNVDCIRPGDRIQASVVSTPGTGSNAGSNVYQLKLTDFTTSGQNFDVTATCPNNECVNSSAEWVVERPAFGIGPGGALFQILPQAYYGETGFQDGTATVAGSGRFFNPWGSTIENYPGLIYDIPMMDDSSGYIMSCPGQTSSPGQFLPFSPTATNQPACPIVTPRFGNFTDTWDSSF